MISNPLRNTHTHTHDHARKILRIWLDLLCVRFLLLFLMKHISRAVIAIAIIIHSAPPITAKII